MSLTIWQRGRITTKIRTDWYTTMSVLCRDGFPVVDSLQEMKIEFARINHPMLPVVSEVLLRLRGSGPDRQKGGGMARTRNLGSELNGLVPTNEALLIESGERAGGLANGLQRAADYVNATNRLGREIKSALIGPGFLLLLLLGILIFFSISILPTFAAISPKHNWPKYARMYGSLADYSIPIAVVIVAGGGALLVGYMKLIRNWIGSFREQLDMRVWPFSAAAQMNSAAMLASLSGFVSAGVPFASAVDLLSQSSDPYMKDVYSQISKDLRSGKRPHLALTQSHIIDKNYHWIINMYGKSSDFSVALSSLSTTFIDFAIEKSRFVFGIIGFIIKLAIVGFVAWTMASMFGIVGSIKGGGL